MSALDADMPDADMPDAEGSAPIGAAQGIMDVQRSRTTQNTEIGTLHCGRYAYNRGMMGFLKAQLDTAERLQPEGLSKEEPKGFVWYLAKGRRLLSRHTEPFDIRTFYPTQSVRYGLEKICEILKELLDELGVAGTGGIKCSVPDDVVENDQLFLHGLLNYVLRGERTTDNTDWLEEWKAVKSDHHAKVGFLKVADETSLQLMRKIGEGGYGTVHEALWDGVAVAVKKPNGVVNIDKLAAAVKEAAMQASLKHENIAQLYAYTHSGWLVMELAQHDLRKVYRSTQPLAFAEKVTYLEQGAAGLGFMHGQTPALVHADVKTANFLVFGAQSDDFRVKVSDFGQTFELIGNRSKTISEGFGTPKYLAPEVILGKASVTPESDTFSFGVVLHEVISGKEPYSGAESALWSLIERKRNREPPCRVPDGCPRPMKELMECCCSFNQKKRPKMRSVGAFLKRLADGEQPTWLDLLPEENGHGPVRHILQVVFKKVEFSEKGPVKFCSARMRDLLRTTASWVRSSYDVVVSAMDPYRGSVVFPFEIEFPSRCCAVQFRENMKERAGEMFQADVELLQFQPQVPVAISDDRSAIDVQVSDLLKQVHFTIKVIAQAADMKYSWRMLKFLQSGIELFAGCIVGLNQESEKDKLRADLAVLLHNMKHALQLLNLHSFVDLYTLCMTADTEMIVNRTLSAIRTFALKWGPGTAADLPAAVPVQHRLHDKQNLNDFLAYVLRGVPCSFQGASAQARQEWESVHMSFLDKLHRLPVVAREDIKWGLPISEDVYEAEWRERKVAVKLVASSDSGDIDLEEFAKFYTRIFSHAALELHHVVTTYAVTTGGAIVMELARTNLMQWYMSLSPSQGSTVAMKVNVLAQAADALASLHAMGIIYGCVKSTNFLVFGEGQMDSMIKIAELQSTIQHWVGARCRASQTARWIAQELCEGRAHSMESDVFSFGAVLFEIVSEKLPYGQPETISAALEAKRSGAWPCAVSDELKMAWPEELLKLMCLCCSSNPVERPSMEAVRNCLLKFKARVPDMVKFGAKSIPKRHAEGGAGAGVGPHPPSPHQQWQTSSGMMLKLSRQVWIDFRGNVCTNSDFFEMKLGDVWAGGREQSRVMSLEVLKKELVALGAPAAEVEQAFVVETIPIHTTKMDYAGNIRRNSVEVGMEVGALEGASMEVEFGPDWTQNYVFSAVPKTLHRFRSRPSAEKMFKWAVLKAPRGRGPLFQRRWFLVMEMWTSSRLVFLKCDRAARVKIRGRVEPPLSINQLVELISGLKLAQVGASLRIDPEFVGLHKVVRDAECACVVKVLNNRPLKSSGRIEKTGFFKSADEAVREERLLDEVARQLKWCQDDVLNDVVTLDDAKLVEVEGGRPGVFESVADFGS